MTRPATIHFAHLEDESVLLARQWVAGGTEQVFAFFSRAHNLEAITPPFLRFRILGMHGDGVQPGERISYRLRLHGWPLRWTSLIDAWKPPGHFRDVQIRGPFKRWEHDHFFHASGGGTWVIDRVRYRLPWHPMAGLGPGPWVERRLRGIFTFRQAEIDRRFG